MSFAYPARRSAAPAVAAPPAAGAPAGRGVRGGVASLVLDGVSLQLRPDKVLGILGPNGSGKTSLLRVLNGTRSPSSGDVRLDDRSLRDFSRKAIAQRIAVVAQETLLAFDYTALELVLMGRHPHLGVLQLEGPADIEIATGALAATGTAQLAQRPFTTLSGGEKQRVVIAAALAQAADVLLLDEPTASLDLGAQQEVAALLRTLHRTRGVSVALATHDLNLAGDLCDELLLLRNGRVLAAGATATTLTAANVRALYGVDVEVLTHAGRLLVVPSAPAGPGFSPASTTSGTEGRW